jgi:menaquinone-specific isochorismate synthase
MTAPASLRQEQRVARIRLVEEPRDLVPTGAHEGFLWWHDGRGLLTEGVAMSIPPASVRSALGAIAVDGDLSVAGTGPIAVGALPFDPSESLVAEMVIPARVWTRDALGRTWFTEISGATEDSEERHRRNRPVTACAGVLSHTREDQWASTVLRALEHIRRGDVEKVVLARQMTVTADQEFSIADVVERLIGAQPHCYVFMADRFMGASPELLVERRGREVRSRPVAGTVPGSDARALAWLGGSEKNRREHQLVVDDVSRSLSAFCTEPVNVSGPAAQPFADMAHMVTDVLGRLGASGSPAPSALELALALHPTPAVAGTPTEAALHVISDLEPLPRDRYAGPVGWVDSNGDGEFAVALRCGEVHFNRARLYSGAGVVAGSDWRDEWLETEAKFGPMLRALNAL